jgi:hypothetical protein
MQNLPLSKDNLYNYETHQSFRNQSATNSIHGASGWAGIIPDNNFPTYFFRKFFS